MAEEKNTTTNTDNDCFVIMPIADPDGYEKGHFNKVYEDIIKVACLNASFNPVRADEVKQTNLIHLDILQKLIDSPMAVCDLSNRNPNVLFELGLRQAFDKPTVLIQEYGTPKIFDISPLRYTEYRKELKYREVLEDQESICRAIQATKEATDKGEGINSIVSLLSLSSPASLKDITENDTAKMMQVIMSEMNDLRTDFRRTLRRIDDSRGLFHNDRLSLLDTEMGRLKINLARLEEVSAKNTSIEIVKKYYDDVQERIARILDLRPPLRIRNMVGEMQTAAERILSQAVNSIE